MSKPKEPNVVAERTIDWDTLVRQVRGGPEPKTIAYHFSSGRIETHEKDPYAKWR